MYFPGEIRVLDFIEQSGRFTLHEHNYKHSNEIHAAERRRCRDLIPFLRLLNHRTNVRVCS